MAITFAGEPLLFDNESGDVGRFLERWQRLEELPLFGPPHCYVNSRANSRSGFAARVGLPIPNWPAPPMAELNTLYWPTGAARWARGLFLTTDAGLSRILQVVGAVGAGGDGGRNGPGVLQISDERPGGYTITPQMYLLPPRPISVPDITAKTVYDSELWLLPLVDKRYFWQSLHWNDDLDLDTATTWTNVLTQLGNRLGETLYADSVHADYFQPDPRELARNFEAIPVLLDSVAACLGQRLVRDLDGTVRMVNATTGGTRLVANLATNHLKIAGGAFSSKHGAAVRPAKVRVVFPRYDLGRPSCDGEVYSTLVTAADAGVVSTDGVSVGLEKVIFDTAFADFDGDVTASTPTNDADLTTLAVKIATDYYTWLANRFDYTFGGVKNWVFTGFEDAAIWTLGRLVDASNETYSQGGGPCEYIASTRAMSLPYNFGVEELCHQFDLPVHDEWLTVELAATLSAGGSANCNIMEHDGSTWNDTGEDITGWDDVESMTGTAGDRAYLHWHCQSKRWQFAQKSC